jgi:hypothetical protein
MEALDLFVARCPVLCMCRARALPSAPVLQPPGKQLQSDRFEAATRARFFEQARGNRPRGVAICDLRRRYRNGKVRGWPCAPVSACVALPAWNLLRADVACCHHSKNNPVGQCYGGASAQACIVSLSRAHCKTPKCVSVRDVLANDTYAVVQSGHQLCAGVGTIAAEEDRQGCSAGDNHGLPRRSAAPQNCMKAHESSLSP